MNQPDTSTNPIEPVSSEGERPFPLIERLAYAVTLSAIVLAVVILLPALIWPNVFGRLMNGYAWTVILVLSYICAPFCRRYIKRTKWG